MVDHSCNSNGPLGDLRKWPLCRLRQADQRDGAGLPHELRVIGIAVLMLVILCFSAEAQMGGYGGPSVLSRGGNRPGQRGSAPIDFNFYAGLRGIAEQGLIAPRLTAQGELESVTDYGFSTEIGVYGGHEWRRSSVGLDYRGDYRRSSRQKYFNGTNQALAFDYQRALGRRMTIDFRETGGTSNRAFGGFAAPAFAEAGRYGVPLNEVYDVRTYYAQTAAAITYQKNARLALVASGTGFFVKRQSQSLVNGQGFSAGGGFQYRLTRRTTAGIEYQYLRFEFPHVYAGTGGHGVYLTLASKLTRRWGLSGNFGSMYLKSFGTQLVHLSPEVAFILGRTSGLASFTHKNFIPNVGVTASYTTNRGAFTMGYSSGAGMGNGIYLTTSQHTVSAGYSYAGLRRMSLGASAGYSRQNSLAANVGAFNSFQGGGAFSYRLLEHLNLDSQLDYRVFRSPGVRGRDGFSASIGLSYSLSRLPISIW